MFSTRRASLAMTLSAVCLLNATAASAAPVTGGRGPGGAVATGVASDLTIWLRGDRGLTLAGSDVTNWDDQSGHSNHFSQATGNQQPDQTTNLNGVPLVTFDGGSAAEPDNMLSTASVSGQTIFVVNRPTSFNGGCCNPLVGDQASYVSIRYDGGAWQTPGDGNDFPFPGGSTVRVDNVATNLAAIGQTHALAAVRGGGAFAFNQLQLAQHNNGGSTLPGRNFGGEIGEVAIYNRVLTTVETTLVNNYLASKYNLPLTSGDQYGGDAPGLGNFDYDVFGIGNDGTSLVSNAGQAGLGIENSAIASGEWVLAGHDGGPNGVTPPSPFGGQRWQRSWYLDTTNLASADLAFDWNDAGNTAPFDAALVGLLYSPTNGGPFTLLTIGTVDIGNQRVDFSGVSLADGYYTLGLVGVPEPSTFALLGLGSIGLAIRSRRRRTAA